MNLNLSWHVNFAPMDWNYYILYAPCQTHGLTADWDLSYHRILGFGEKIGGLAKKLVFTHNKWPVYHEDMIHVSPHGTMDDPPERIHQGRVNAKHVKPRIQIAKPGLPGPPENATDATAPGAPGAPDTTCSSLSSLMSILKPFLKAFKSCRVQRPPNTRGQLETMGNANGTQFGSAN